MRTGDVVNVLAALAVVMTPVRAAADAPDRWASPTQGEAFRYGPYPMCMSGGWGSGKTFVGCLKGIYLSTEYPKNRGVIARHVGKRTARDDDGDLLQGLPAAPLRPSPRRPPQRPGTATSSSRTPAIEILFLHLDDPETAGIIRGLEINWFLIDQAEENPEHMEEIFDLLSAARPVGRRARCRSGASTRFTARDREPWPYMHPEKRHAGAAAVPDARVQPRRRDALALSPLPPESAEHHDDLQGAGLQDVPHAERGQPVPRRHEPPLPAGARRGVHSPQRQGLWGSPRARSTSSTPVGDRGLAELVEYFRQHCTLFRTMDYGDSAPTCVLWWAVDRNGNCICFREYYLPNALISTHRQNITSLSEYERYEIDLADPSIFHQMPAEAGRPVVCRRRVRGRVRAAA
jgi:hypothetical protein